MLAMVVLHSLPSPPSCSTAPLIRTSAHRNAPNSSPIKKFPWLIVGLGNPARKYEGTRHNIGFEMIDAIAEAEGIRLNTVQHRALTGKGEIGDAQVLLAKPMTFVNLSGESVGPLAAYYCIPVQQILVVFDDMELELAVMRLLSKGGHGGHSGIKSIIQHLKASREFPRLRIGIGKPPGNMDPKTFVLQHFSEREREEVDISIARGVDAIRQVTNQGIEKAAATWNEIRKSRVKLTKEESEMLSCI